MSFRLSVVRAAGVVWLASCGLEAPPPAAVSSEATADAAHRHARVLRVGSWHGKRGPFPTIQAAVNAASPDDWILIGEGDFRETGDPASGVLITTPRLHLRGMDRNRTIVDGTQVVGGEARPCNPAPEAQVVTTQGRNGIQVFKVDGVSIENLTVCNYLSNERGAVEAGNQIWWNGGDGSGQIGLGTYHGAYLTASTTFSTPEATARYGVFTSNSRGPGVFEHLYASNMSDSSFYVGACPDCNATLRHVHAQNSAQGFSGTNAGGHLVLEDSEWDQNRVGIASTTLADDDPPSPQNGACPDHPGRSCTLIRRNHVHDNNRATTPGAGIAGSVPVGTGILISGGRNDTLRDNLITHNGAWGVMLNDYPDFAATTCNGGTPGFNPPAPFDLLLGPIVPCYFHSFGTEVSDNLLAGNGFFGNATNGDLANAALPSSAANCFRHNRKLGRGGITSAPVAIEDPAVLGSCGAAWAGDTDQEMQLFAELLCDTFGPASGACAPTEPGYPVPGTVTLLPIPHEPGMRNPCEGVPENPWCD